MLLVALAGTGVKNEEKKGGEITTSPIVSNQPLVSAEDKQPQMQNSLSLWFSASHEGSLSL